MGKRPIDRAVKCPHYHSDDAQHIYCDGVNDENWVHLAFPGKRKKQEYKCIYCRENWKRCLLARMQGLKG